MVQIIELMKSRNKFYYQKQKSISYIRNKTSFYRSMSQQMQRKEVIEQLMRMLDNISQNAGYLRYFENENVLVDPKVYFDICQITFSELSIKLIKIQEYEGYDDGEKLDCLIKLITDQLGVYMPGLSGKEIIKFNISHIYEFLHLLLEYSKLYFERGFAAIQPSIKTEPNEISGEYSRQNDKNKNPFTARPQENVQYSQKSSQHQHIHENIRPLKQNKHGNKQNNKNQNETQKVGNGFSKTKHAKNSSNHEKQSLENVRPVSAQAQKKKKSELLYDELIKVVIDEKNRANKSSLRDQRKNKNEDIIEARRKYHQYLKSYSKQNRAQTERKSILKGRSQRIQSSSNPRQLPLKDFQNVENFFKSFSYKLRDVKDVYIQRMKKEIRKKEQQKMIYKNRLERESKQLVDRMISTEIDCLNHEHHLRKSEIKETASQLQEEITLVQKEMKRKSSQRKKELKEMKQNDLKNLQNLIRQQNQRILMELQAGGRMERLILDAYGKF